MYKGNCDRSKAKDREWKKPLVLLPTSHEYYQKVYQCVHGDYERQKGNGKRFQAMTKYTGCEARVTVELKRLGTGEWVVMALKEVS